MINADLPLQARSMFDCSDWPKHSIVVYWLGKLLNCENIVFDKQGYYEQQKYMMIYYDYEHSSMIEIKPQDTTLDDEEIRNMQNSILTHPDDVKGLISVDIKQGFTYDIIKFLLDYSSIINNMFDRKSSEFKELKLELLNTLNTSYILSDIEGFFHDNLYGEKTDYLLLFKMEDDDDAERFMDMWRHIENENKNYIEKNSILNLSILRSPFGNDTSIILGIRCNERSTLIKTKLVKGLWSNFYIIVPNLEINDLEKTVLYQQLT